MPEKKSVKTIQKELSDIIDKLGKTESTEDIPAIERDIILSQIREVYEELSGSPQQVHPTEKEFEPEEEPVISEKEEPDEEDILTETLELDEQEKIQNDINPPEDKSEHKKDSQSEATEEIKDSPEVTQDNKKKQKHGIIAEKLTGEKQYVHDTLADKSQKKNVSTTLQSKPITDIAAAIGINDRFQLIRDLFNGDKATFNKTVEKLNAAENFNEAFTFINENFDWDMEDPSVHLILELVRRKFIVKKDE